jgi:hypothetical protein
MTPKQLLAIAKTIERKAKLDRLAIQRMSKELRKQHRLTCQCPVSFNVRRLDSDTLCIGRCERCGLPLK